jgi:hypothetical protein
VVSPVSASGNGDDEPEERRDAAPAPETIRLAARVNPVGIRLRQHLWPIWAEIAIDEEAKARATRAEEVKLAAEHPDKQGLGELLVKELKASLVSIAAASHSLTRCMGYSP